MMVLSDNMATNLLITVLGMENINARAEQLGVDEIELNRMMMDFDALAEGRDNHLTACLWLVCINTFLNVVIEMLMVEKCGIFLGRQQFRDILPFLLGKDTLSP